MWFARRFARKALLPLEQVLMHRKVLIVVDNLESVLPKAAAVFGEEHRAVEST